MGKKFLFVIFFLGTTFLYSLELNYKKLTHWCLKYNPILSSKRSEVKKAVAQYEKSLKAYVPDLNFNLSGQRSRNVYRDVSSSRYGNLITGLSTRQFYQNLWSYNLSLQGVAWNHQLELMMRKYILLLDLSRLSFHKTQAEVFWKLFKSYLEVLKNKALLEQEKDNLKLSELQYQLVKNKFDSGLIVKTDLLRAELQLSEEKEKLIVAQNNYYLSLLNLKKQIGSYKVLADSEIIFSHNEKFFSFLEKVKEKYLSRELFYRRPEYQSLEKQIKLAEIDKKLKEAEYLPTVSYSISYQKSDSEFFPEKNSLLSGRISFDYDLLDFGKRGKEILAAKWQKEVYEKQKKDLYLELKYQLETAKVKIKELEKRLEVLQEAVRVSKENYNLLKSQYQSGLSTILDLTDGEVRKNQTQTNYITLKYSYYQAIIDLLYYQGVLLKNFNLERKIGEIRR